MKPTINISDRVIATGIVDHIDSDGGVWIVFDGGSVPDRPFRPELLKLANQENDVIDTPIGKMTKDEVINALILENKQLINSDNDRKEMLRLLQKQTYLSIRESIAVYAPKISLLKYILTKISDWNFRVSRTWYEIDAEHRYNWADSMILKSKEE